MDRTADPLFQVHLMLYELMPHVVLMRLVGGFLPGATATQSQGQIGSASRPPSTPMFGPGTAPRDEPQAPAQAPPRETPRASRGPIETTILGM